LHLIKDINVDLSYDNRIKTRSSATDFQHGCQPVRSAYQPPANSIFLSEQTSHQQSVSSTFLSEQISTSNQPPGKKTCSACQ
jgi:hypothetical protein